MSHKDWPFATVDKMPTEPATPPSAPSGVGGLSANQIARQGLEAQQRAAAALEEIGATMRAAAESLAPVLLALAEGLGPALAQATKDLREVGGKILAALEYSPLDTHDD